ncbi:Thioredoxin domain-containing protein [Tenacibaculum sp. 190524A02b]|uniref:peroxiredoxin family protein n=1 Tax=Tenacibaculum vairaonense TaxID=3137860 RepID=UPI0032B19783
MKNFIKSLFISGFPVFALVVFIINLISFSYTLHEIGILISSLSIVLFFSLLFIKPVARTSKNLLFYSTPITFGLALNFINFEKNNLLIAVLLAVGWLAYLTWYSTFSKRVTPALSIGKKLPDFALENSLKEKITTNQFSGNFKIFLFYRGNWCPLCMAQIKEVVTQYKELKSRNTDVILVSPQPHKFSENLAKKHQVPFHFLVDTKSKVAKQLGIFHKNGLPAGFQVFGYDSDVVMPTVIITNKDNNIIFADLTDNYRVRPEPETFLSIIDNYKD